MSKYLLLAQQKSNHNVCVPATSTNPKRRADDMWNDILAIKGLHNKQKHDRWNIFKDIPMDDIEIVVTKVAYTITKA